MGAFRGREIDDDAAEKRSATLDLEEFQQTVAAADASDADGVVFFLWSDFLRQALDDGDFSRVDVMRAFRQGG